MRIAIAPAAGERELFDRKLVGEWADALVELCKEAASSPWGVYVARSNGEAVGIGLFKGPPDELGWVEAAYLTFIPNRGRGIATAIAEELVRFAAERGVTGVRAHTLPEESSSTAVLHRNGFICRGPIIDPEDGEVWRWERPLGAKAARPNSEAAGSARAGDA